MSLEKGYAYVNALDHVQEAFMAATLVFFSSPRGALYSHSPSEMVGLLLDGRGLLSGRA